MAQWARSLNGQQCLLAGWAEDSSACVQIQIWKGVFQLDWTSGHAVRLNSQTGIEGPPLSSLNCGRSLHSGLNGDGVCGW